MTLTLAIWPGVKVTKPWCLISTSSNMTVRIYGSDKDLDYVCSVTLTFEIWPWANVMTHFWVFDINCVKYYPVPTRQWRVMARTPILRNVCIVTLTLEIWPWVKVMTALGSSATIVWNIIQIHQRGKKIWPGHHVNRRADGRTDRQTDGQTG